MFYFSSSSSICFTLDACFSLWKHIGTSINVFICTTWYIDTCASHLCFHCVSLKAALLCFSLMSDLDFHFWISIFRPFGKMACKFAKLLNNHLTCRWKIHPFLTYLYDFPEWPFLCSTAMFIQHDKMDLLWIILLWKFTHLALLSRY